MEKISGKKYGTNIGTTGAEGSSHLRCFTSWCSCLYVPSAPGCWVVLIWFQMRTPHWNI